MFHSFSQSASQRSKRIQDVEGRKDEDRRNQEKQETKSEGPKDRLGDTDRPGKKRREESPEPSQIKWRIRPTFLAIMLLKGDQ